MHCKREAFHASGLLRVFHKTHYITIPVENERSWGDFFEKARILSSQLGEKAGADGSALA